MKPGDIVHIWSEDAKTYRGEALLEAVEDNEIIFCGSLPPGTVKGDILMNDEQCKAMMAEWAARCKPQTVSVPKDFFGEMPVTIGS